ncbi:MAG: thiamine diphosphokinase [Bacillota bacterium]
MMKNAIIALNGELDTEEKEYKKMFKNIKGSYIAADGGALLMQKLDIKPDLIIGDLDSLTESDISEFEEKKIKLKKYPSDKNETDGELAVNYCIENNFDKIIITFALGGRCDQQLANIFLLEYAQKHGVTAIIKEGAKEIGLVNKEKIIKNKVDWGLSLIPIDSLVEDVNVSGCKYNLDSFDLQRSKSRGISNLITDKEVLISHGRGNLLYILNKNMHSSC